MDIDKTLYEREKNELITKYKNINVSDLEYNLDRIYEATTSKEFETGTIHTVINEVLEALFGVSYLNEVLIPLSFLESEIGKAIWHIKYGVPERIYTAREIADITGYTRQMIYYDINNKILKPTSADSKTFTFYESEVLKYFKLKDIPLENLYFFKQSKK